MLYYYLKIVFPVLSWRLVKFYGIQVFKLVKVFSAVETLELFLEFLKFCLSENVELSEFDWFSKFWWLLDLS